jgi:hypothetical protein
MSYRCEVCRGVAPPGTPERHHIVKKTDGNIARVLRVCEDCQHELGRGTSLVDLCRRLRAPAVPLPRPAPARAEPVFAGHEVKAAAENPFRRRNGPGNGAPAAG